MILHVRASRYVKVPKKVHREFLVIWDPGCPLVSETPTPPHFNEAGIPVPSTPKT